MSYLRWVVAISVIIFLLSEVFLEGMWRLEQYELFLALCLQL